MSYLIRGRIRARHDAALDLSEAAVRGISRAVADLIRESKKQVQEIQVEFAREKERWLAVERQKAMELQQRLSESLNLAKRADAERLLPEKYQNCSSSVHGLESVVNALGTTESVKRYVQKAEEAGKRIEQLIRDAEQQKEFETVVKKSMEALANQGFQITVERGDPNKVALLGQAGEKRVRFDVDAQGNMNADFSEGYGGIHHSECLHDLERFIGKLSKDGIGVQIEKAYPVSPNGGLTHVKKRTQQKAKAAPNAAGI